MGSNFTPSPLKGIQGYLAHTKTPPPLGPPKEPRHGPNVRSYGVEFFYERGTPVHPQEGVVEQGRRRVKT